MLAQNRVNQGRDLLRPDRRPARRVFEPLHSSRENSPDSQGHVIASGNGRSRRNQRASRAGAGPLESDEDDLLQDLDESRQDDLDDDDEELAVDEIDPETGEDNAVRSSASSPPLASYDNRAQGLGVSARLAAQATSSERRINAVINRMQADDASGSSSSNQQENNGDDDNISDEHAVPGQSMGRQRGPLQHHLE